MVDSKLKDFKYLSAKIFAIDDTGTEKGKEFVGKKSQEFNSLTVSQSIVLNDNGIRNTTIKKRHPESLFRRMEMCMEY